ncbi:YqhA family protein [Alteromonas gilva]|uniref:YqhA family protein n=1 Tax=Alteromonas gilva TaxID=2987522 RepID=A0ABT5L5W8_9ALTE|nr:YqhA family protein [Alteromonas gilva]MDC8832458.1 YqhA family protein [Alteromonas gilva]
MQEPNDKKFPAFKYEKQFERFLWRSRLLVLLAVVPSLAGALVLLLVGTADIIGVVVAVGQYYLLGMGTNIHDSIVPDIIMAVDIYLIAVVLLIFGTGIYRLFVSPIDEAENYHQAHPFNVNSFDELKDKIARVVILAVIIEFFRAVVDIRFQTPLDAIFLAVSIMALALGLYLMARAHVKGDSHH